MMIFVLLIFVIFWWVQYMKFWFRTKKVENEDFLFHSEILRNRPILPSGDCVYEVKNLCFQLFLSEIKISYTKPTKIWQKWVIQKSSLFSEILRNGQLVPSTTPTFGNQVLIKNFHFWVLTPISKILFDLHTWTEKMSSVKKNILLWKISRFWAFKFPKISKKNFTEGVPHLFITIFPQTHSSSMNFMKKHQILNLKM